jgi:Leucine-rich repeat (LRR) protein
MKKNDWILLISVLLYSYLFYKQSAGINFLLFNIALIAGSALKNPDSIKTRSWITAAVGAMISSVCVMYYSSPIAIVANIISLALLAYFSLAPNTSVILALIMEAVAIGSSCVYMFFDWAKRSKNKTNQTSKPLYVILVMIAIITVITILFFNMYQSANPVFNEFTRNINLDFISWPWIFFTLGGLLLLYGFYYNWKIDYFNDLDEQAPNTINPEDAGRNSFLNTTFKTDTEYTTGAILFGLLNAMLLLLNVLDLNYLWFDGKLPEEVDHKEFVHNGIGMLITSILFAIIIILYFFRGRLNYYEKGKYLKWLACFWILQNAFMIFSSVYRTNMYVEEFGISYKKIGVYVYLGLTLIGLITTYIKVTRLKSNWYLVRVNTWCYFILLVVSCIFNWDVIITDYNIKKALTEHKKLEKYYLADLSFKNLPQLLRLNDSIKSNDDFGVRDYYWSSRGTYFYNFKTALDNKLFRFMKEMRGAEWQSWCKEKSRTLNDILAIHEKGEIKKMDLSQCGCAYSILPIKEFNKLEELDLSQNFIDSIENLAFFPRLKKLSLNNCGLDTISKFPFMKELTQLNISNNRPVEVASLKNAPKLAELDLSSCSLSSVALPDLPQLKKLDLSGNPLNDLSSLAKYKELKELKIMNTFKGDLTLPAMDKLESIDIGSNLLDRFNSAGVFAKLRACKNLKSIKADNNALERLNDLLYNDHAGIDSAGMSFPLLEELNISNNTITYLGGLSQFKNLKTLVAANNKFTRIEDLCKIRTLTDLDISGNAVKSLRGIEQLKQLQTLDLSFCGIVQDMNAISSMKNLVSLRIAANNLNSIKDLLELRELKILYLQGNRITTIAGIEKLVNLEELNLRDNSINDYSPLYTMKNLKVVYVDGMPKQKLLKLKKSLPNCTVYDYDPNNFYRTD